MKPNLDELERLSKSATPGPWWSSKYGAIYGSVQLDDSFVGQISEGADNAYIIAACNSLPELINENRALQKRVRELERQSVVLASHLSKHVLHTMSTKEWLEWSESVAKETKC